MNEILGERFADGSLKARSIEHFGKDYATLAAPIDVAVLAAS